MPDNEQIVIPPEVMPIYERLSASYSLEFEPLTIRSRRFHFLRIRDIEPLIAGKDIFAESTEFPFWVKIWEASVLLGQFLACMPPNPELRILELGAGLGVSGLVASAFGHRVTITDYQDSILDYPRVSAAVNGCHSALMARLDWMEPADLGTFDVIIGAEVLFHPRFFQPLLTVFREYLAPGGVIYLAHDQRRKSLAGFLPLCEKDYQIAVQKKRLQASDESVDILLTRLTPRKE